MFFDLGETLAAARPNPGHRALAELEAAGRLAGVITQNIDNLHQAAGSRHVVELHGGDSRLLCMRCDRRYPRTEIAIPTAPDGSREPPVCPTCATVLKPDVVLFGEFLPNAALEESTRLARSCRLMLVIGTSALVSPASDIPLLAQDSGAVLVEINLDRTGLTRQCRHRLVGSASETLPALVAAVRA
jgi:NAD-dependent deacetylase